MLGEAEFSGGIANCPNTYTNIVITLPANVTYYTYQIRSMFIDSSRPELSQICVQFEYQRTLVQSKSKLKMEPLPVSPLFRMAPEHSLTLLLAVGLHITSANSYLTMERGWNNVHRLANRNSTRLILSPEASKGALKASNGLIELLPVSSPQVQFTYAYDITWQGAVATFDGTTPICNLYDGTTPAGLWILLNIRLH